jgi:hypothetical protein
VPASNSSKNDAPCAARCSATTCAREDSAGHRFDWVASDFVDLAAQLGA